MNEPYQPPPRSMFRKLLDACDGIRRGLRGQSSFTVHAGATPLVIVAAAVLRATMLEWCLLLLCVGAVWAAEMFNTALEFIARATTDEYHEDIKHGLNIASGAVLIVAVTAAVIGAIVLGHRLLRMLGF